MDDIVANTAEDTAVGAEDTVTNKYESTINSNY